MVTTMVVVAIQAPRGLARINRAVVNPIQLRYAWRVPPWAVILHRGRRSGRSYRTPVVGWMRGGAFAVVLFYGEDADWVRNVLAGGGQVVRGGRTYELVAPRVVDVGDAGDDVSAVARLLGHAPGKLLVGRLGG